MKKPADAAAAETAVRDAAANLKTAIDYAREHGLAVAFPTNPEGLLGIAISETGRTKVITTVAVDPAAPAAPSGETIAQAEAAAQKAANQAIEKNAAKS